MSADLTSLGLTEIAGLIRRRKVSSVEATRACLARIEAWDPTINAFIAVEAEAALGHARRLDHELKTKGRRGSLHGVPLAYKDMFYRKGKISSAGSKIRRRWVAPYTSTVMAKLEAAGAVCLGRLNMAEFAADPTGHNKHFGPCRNPWNPAYITGGSSSGSGAALAARLVFGALGSDTGGSVRLPAAANGVVGICTTQGRVSRHGAVPRAWTLDRVGPLARTVRDCARLLRIVAGYDSNDGMSSREPVPDYERALATNLRGFTVGVPADHFYDDATRDVAARLSESLRVLRALGARIVSVGVPPPVLLFRLNDLITKCEGATAHGRWLRERPEDYADYLRARLEGGLLIPATRYIEALALRGPMLSAFLETALRRVDVLHCPVIPHSLPRLDEFPLDGARADVLARAGRLSNLTRLFNYLGVPSLSVPCGFDRNGLPVAFQLVGRPFDEARLLAVAHAYQTATDWHERVPIHPASSLIRPGRIDRELN